MTARKRHLVIGYGNPGRLDDGLGPAFAHEAARLDIDGVDCDADYQLTVESAADIADYDVVLFVDADCTGATPFSITRLEPGSVRPTFSSHHIDPAGVLALAQQLFNVEPECWLVGIRGYTFNAFGEGLSTAAQVNLRETLDVVGAALRAGDLHEVRARRTSTPEAMTA